MLVEVARRAVYGAEAVGALMIGVSVVALVALTGSALPDLVVGALTGLLVLVGAPRIFGLARA